MIISIYPAKDSTIYNSSIYMNSGLDEVLELTKEISGSSDVSTNNSRILMKFDTADIQNAIASLGAISPRYRLNLYTLSADEIPTAYTVEVRAISQSWEMGIGKTSNNPTTTDGVSWKYRDRYLGEAWATESLASGSENYFDIYSNPGGATWYSAYQASQSYDFESTDLNLDITTFVNAWLTGSIVNDGIIIKRTNSEESNNSYMGSLKFFSRDTHTIYPPKLNIAWDDSVYTTGSLRVLTSDESFLIYSPNIEGTYHEKSKTKIRIIGREKYPTRTYSTQSVYTTVTRCLPSSSFYSIIDATSYDTVIPFDEDYTKLSCDENGNYFKLWMDSFQPERTYKILIKVRTSDIETITDDFIFKVVK